MSLSDSQRIALDLLAEYETVQVAEITHRGYAGREGVSVPGIAGRTAKWLVEHGYATRWSYAHGKLVQNDRGPYIKAAR